VAFSPDRRLVWGSTDGTVKVWDGPDTELHVLRGHTSWVQAVSINADGTRIASASLDGTVKIWQAPQKANPLTLIAPTPKDSSVSSPGGSHVVETR
jgi:WD40 repeat protein